MPTWCLDRSLDVPLCPSRIVEGLGSGNVLSVADTE